MRILAIHSRYRLPGGEDVSFDADVAHLRGRGHEVAVFQVDSAEYARRPPKDQLNALLLHDAALESQLLAAVSDLRPDVAYLNNWFPWLAPLLESLAHRVPVLVNVGNYRLWCLNGLFFRSGRRCTACLDGSRWNGVLHGCYRGRASSIVALRQVRKANEALFGCLSAHFAPVSTYVADILVESGVARSRVHVKPNLVNPVPSVGPGGPDVLFAGRLEPEKGFEVFLSACESVGVTGVVAGDGSLRDRASDASDYRGVLRPEEVLDLMGQSLVTVVPSLWDEPFGRVAAESLGCGTPVIVSARGGLQSVGDASCSIIVEPGDVSSLADAILRMRSQSYWSSRGREAARERFLSNYAPQTAGRSLEAALRAASGTKQGRN